ncbi:MAG: diguanylate cyclase, partial [Paracoccaceae bacterium]
MSGRILIIDPDEARRGALTALLRRAYFDVCAVAVTPETVESPPDLLIAAADTGGIDPSALRSRFGAAPVLLIAGAGARAAFLAGADDWLSRPAEARLVLARARRLIRRRATEAELVLRAATASELGLNADPAPDVVVDQRLLLVAPRSARSDALRDALTLLTGAEVRLAAGGFEAMRMVETDPPDAVIVADGVARLADPASGFAEGEDAIGLIGALRSRAEARRGAIIHLDGGRYPGRAAAALEAGADESAPDADEPLELAARILAELAARRRVDAMREGLERGFRAAADDALTDPLTGLRNRRYFDRHIVRLFARARAMNAPLAALIFDLDRFKTVNDAHGHEAGDCALQAFAARLQAEVRGADLVARVGGEEFAVILQNASAPAAAAAAE